MLYHQFFSVQSSLLQRSGCDRSTDAGNQSCSDSAGLLLTPNPGAIQESFPVLPVSESEEVVA